MEQENNDREILTCVHDQYSVEAVKRCPFSYLKLLVDEETFPNFQPGLCSQSCKEKMKEILEITFDTYKRLTQQYFEDAKVLFDPTIKNGCTVWEYYACLVENDLDEDTTLYSNIDMVNGRVVRLCNNSNEFIRDYRKN